MSEPEDLCSPLSITPAADIQRIIVFGDTGCRINKKKKSPQDCVNGWPYQKIARHAAAAHPDLVIHIGDYLYREACNADTTNCSKMRTGYGWEEWREDFFNLELRSLLPRCGSW